MIERPRVIAALAVVLLVGSLGAAAATTTERVLVVEDAQTGQTLTATPVADGSTVTLSYTHSVEQTPVEDIYTVAGLRLDNTEMRFESYGWGLPSGADVRRVNGTFVFDPNRSYTGFTVQPSPIANHRLTVDGETYDLVALSAADAVRITVTRHRTLRV